EVWVTQIFPGPFQRRPEMFKEMRESSRASAQCKCFERSCCCPTKSNRTGNNLVQAFYTYNPLAHEINAFPEKSRLKPVGHEAGNFFFDYNRAFANGCIKLNCFCNCFFAGSFTWH